jgi:hypothetical protein
MVPEWYYADQGQQQGPVTFADLQGLAAEGRLRPSDLVWKTGWPNWAAAGTQPGLFAAPATATQRLDRAPAPCALAWEDVPPDPWDQGRSIYARREYQRRVSAGNSFAAFAFGAGLLLFVVACGVVAGIVTTRGTGDQPKQTAKNDERTWRLDTGTHQSWTIPFNFGDDVTIRVTSDHDSDVDLFVFADEAKMNALMRSGNVERSVGLCVAYDNSPSKDCYVRFRAPRTGTYYVLVANRNSLDQPHRNQPNSGKLTFFPVR